MPFASSSSFFLPLLALILLGLSATPSLARADSATVRLTDGGIVAGEIEVYEPGRRIVVRTASGEVFTIPAERVSEIHIQGGHAAPPASATEEPPVVVVAPPAYQLAPQGVAPPTATALSAPTLTPPGELDPRLQRMPSLFWPMALLGASAAVVAVGGVWVADAVYCRSSSYSYDCSYERRMGGLMVGLAAPMLVVSAAFLLPRKVRARRRLRARRRALSVSAAPLVDPRRGDYGVGATLTF